MVMKMELRLALVLVTLASRLHDVGRLDESLAASDEAIALATKHADRSVGRTELARAWGNRASTLISRRAYAEAAAAAAKAVDLYETASGKAMARNTFALHEELVARNPGRYQRELDRARRVAAQL